MDHKPIFVLYHANCADGFGAAWAAWMHYKSDAQYIPVSYGKPVPDLPDGARVFIVDFSFPREELLALAARCVVTVIDHHKTAQEALAGLEFALFDMTKSGAVLTWEYFFPGQAVPEMLLYVQDRDLWQWKLPWSKEINAALWRGMPRDLGHWQTVNELWDKGVTSGKDRLIAAGEAIAYADTMTVTQLCKHPAWVQVLAWKVPAVNSPVLQSEIGHALLEQHPTAPFALIWWILDDGKPVFSLRGRDGDFDVSAVAKEFGGGGHKAAAGFKRDEMFEFVHDGAVKRPANSEPALRQVLGTIHELVEGYADGAPDASARDHLANEVAGLASPWRDAGALDGAARILLERNRQMTQEGYAAKQDDLYVNGELRDAAIAYAMVCDDRAGETGHDIFPWEPELFKVSEDPRRNLEKAGALIAAEIDRLDREAAAWEAGRSARAPFDDGKEGTGHGC